MPGGKSDYLEAQILDHVLGGADFVRPATVHLALSTTTPTDAGGITEPSGGAYARQAITNDATNFRRRAARIQRRRKMGPWLLSRWRPPLGARSSAGRCSMPRPPATCSIGEDVTPSKTVGLDDQPKFAVNGLKVTED